MPRTIGQTELRPNVLFVGSTGTQVCTTQRTPICLSVSSSWESVHGIFFFSLFLSLIEGGGQYAHLRTPAASFFGPPIEGEDEAIMAELAALGVGDATTDGVFPALVDLITSFGQRQLGEWAPPH